MITSYLLFIPLGAITGILAGLLGIGGGVIIVPMVSLALDFQGISTPYNHAIALGTSLATIMFTSSASFINHHKNKAVVWKAVAKITPGLLIGTFTGSYLAAHVPSLYLKIFFVVFLYYVGCNMVFNKKPAASRELPGLCGNSLAGFGIGSVSSLVGIGGGTLSVPYLTWCNVPIRMAIGTSAAIGFPNAFSGTIAYIYNGLQVADQLPDHSVGFIYIPALVGIAVVSVLTVPLGVKLVHKLPVAQLKKLFACIIFVMATQMLYRLCF